MRGREREGEGRNYMYAWTSAETLTLRPSEQQQRAAIGDGDDYNPGTLRRVRCVQTRSWRLLLSKQGGYAEIAEIAGIISREIFDINW